MEALPDSPPTDATECQRCGSPELSKATSLPVCEPCRASLVRTPFPGWVKGSAGVVLVLLLISVWQTPTRWRQALQLKQAEKLAANQKWRESYEHFLPFREQALEGSEMELALEFAESAAMSGHLDDAASVLDKLSGRSGTHEVINKARHIEQLLRAKMVSDTDPPPGSASSPLRQ